MLNEIIIAGIYRIAGNFRGVLIFVIFVTIPRVTKFSTHEIFHPRIFSRLLRIGLRESRNLKPRKLILKTRDSFSRKFAPPKITRYTVYADRTISLVSQTYVARAEKRGGGNIRLVYLDRFLCALPECWQYQSDCSIG